MFIGVVCGVVIWLVFCVGVFDCRCYYDVVVFV